MRRNTAASTIKSLYCEGRLYGLTEFERKPIVQSQTVSNSSHTRALSSVQAVAHKGMLVGLGLISMTRRAALPLLRKGMKWLSTAEAEGEAVAKELNQAAHGDVHSSTSAIEPMDVPVVVAGVGNAAAASEITRAEREALMGIPVS